MAGLFTQLNGLLGGPGDNQSLATGLTNLAAAFAIASQAPSTSASSTGVLNALNNLASQHFQCLQHHHHRCRARSTARWSTPSPPPMR